MRHHFLSAGNSNMIAAEPQESDSTTQTFRDYGAQAIRDALVKMLGLAGAVREGADIEAIHDMRVASRRLRAAITLFGAAFASKEFERFEKVVKAVTRELGAARDLDVMIETLEKLETTLLPSEQAGVDDFVRIKRKEREEMQPHVTQALDRMEKRDLLSLFDQIAAEPPSRTSEDRDSGPSGIDPAAPARENAPHIVPQRVAELLSWEPHIDDPTRVEELHNMRIAAKRLRYTLELFAPLYGGELKSPISQVKKIQEQLGEIHDADVLGPALASHLRRMLAPKKDWLERGVYGIDTDAAQGVLTLCRSRREARHQVYERFLQTWSGLHAAGFFDRLWVIINGKAADREPVSDEKNGAGRRTIGTGDDTTENRRAAGGTIEAIGREGDPEPAP